MVNWKLKKIKVSELKENPRNPRNLTEKGLKDLENSIKKFGVAEPLVANADYMICGGHGRKKILERLNIQEVDCYLPEKKLTPKQFDELGIRLNKNIAGEFNFDILANEFEVDELIEWGFEEKELDLNLWNEISDEKLDEVPEIPKKAISKLGDLFLIDGKHRVMCGDSTKAEDVEKLMDGKKADMVFTDPPYEMETQGGGILKNANSMKQIKNNKVDKFNPSSLILYAKTNIFFHNKPLIKKYIELAESNKQNYDLCFYKKENTAPNYNSHLMTDVEYIAIIGDLNPNKGMPKDMYSKSFTGGKDLDNKLSYSKPVKLCEKYILLYSNKTVSDSFLGSGSTLIACQQTNRTCYGMELDPIYIDVILKRYKKLYPEAKFECLNSKFDFDKLFTDD